ncbi:MAG TPA: crosslink repair DNA glycosylase YcaQ family protein [Ornithinibacter sp.]|nr:crosslink repair DNA glycosylase YcaQ family protein [Ornithinibacter sp.]
MVHHLSRRDARRIAVRAQLLDAPRPTDLLEVLRRLTLVQFDLTAHVAPSADLVLWGRLGRTYSPVDLDGLLESGRVVELGGLLRPAEDIALFRAEMRAWPGPEPWRDWQVANREWLHANRACHDDVLERLRSDGPLPARELPDTCVVPWRSSGWNDDRNVRMLLAVLEERGEVAVAGREGRERLWDLAERVFPDTPTVPLEESRHERDRRRLRALGIARATAQKHPYEPNDVGDAGEPAEVEGVRGRWRVDPEQLDRPFRGRAALLSPLDRLVIDRTRLADLFESDYQLEMYKPAASRRWGYWAMPVLHGDRLVGKLDATTDLGAGILRVNALHWDLDPSRAMADAVHREVRALATWLDVDLVGLDPS